MECFSRPKYFYIMFQVGINVFKTLHDLLVSIYGLKLTSNVSSIESLDIFLWIIGGLQVENILRGHFGPLIQSLCKYCYVCAS